MCLRSTGLTAADLPCFWLAAGLSKEARLEASLQAIEKEVAAVEAGLEGLDDAEAAEAADSDAQAEEGAAPKAEASVAARPADRDLQRAGLQQRLADLRVKQQRVQAALQAERADAEGGEQAAAAAAAAVQLQEDAGFDEELNAASSSALVETERDRLIRLVRRRALHACTHAPEMLMACRGCQCRMQCFAGRADAL
jgi:hypothetical protein